MGSDKHWEVVGGAEKGGILVREGAELKAQELQPRLGVGAAVRKTKIVSSYGLRMSKQVLWWSKLVSCRANDSVFGRFLGLAQTLAGLASV